jgi:hypothetical protein
MTKIPFKCKLGLHCWHEVGRDTIIKTKSHGNGFKDTIEYTRDGDKLQCCHCPATGFRKDSYGDYW